MIRRAYSTGRLDAYRPYYLPVREMAGYKACESCQYSSSDSDSDSGDDINVRMTSELEIPVRVGGCEKWITGLTRRTTCDDVIYALLANESNANDILNVQDFAMFERWREVERPLKGRTKILKVWRAWGAECRNVKLFIRKTDYAYDSGSEASRPKRHSSRKQSGHILKQHRDPATKGTRDGSNHRHQSGDRERARRRSHTSGESRHHHRQHSRSLERRLKDYYGRDRSGAIPSGAKYPEDPMPADGEKGSKSHFFHYMVKMILDQEKKLADQSDRLRDTDDQIDNYETRMHVLRVEKDGQNYVQDAYLQDIVEENSSSSEEHRTSVAKMAATEQELEDYIGMCEKVIELEDKILKEEDQIQDLSVQVANESVVEWDNHSLASGYSGCEGKSLPIRSSLASHLQKYKSSSKDDTLMEELSKVRKEIERSVALSTAQQKQLVLVEETLGECEVQLQRKRLLLNQLMVEVDEKSKPQTSLSKFMSKSCEVINDVPKPEAEDPYRSVDDLLYLRKDNRHQYNSDSGVESVDHKPDTTPPLDVIPDMSVRSEIDVNDVPYIKKAPGRRSMVPYFTYATYDKESKSNRSIRDVTQGLPSGCRKSVTSEGSDTGLSSLHSEEHSPVLETLV